MKRCGKTCLVLLIAVPAFLSPALHAQQPVVLDPDAVGKLTPANFYFEGQLGPTQMRNAAGIQFGRNRHLIAALVDTSGYATNVREKYEGFLISDEPVIVGTARLSSGAYGFGFTENQKMNIFDIGGKLLHSIDTVKDDKTQSPRPLTIIRSGNDLRLYRGRSFVVLSPR